jgi:arylsulfate sulfotransferase
MSEHINHIVEESLMARQHTAERTMLERFEQGNYTIDHPLIQPNPYLINPCAAMALFRTENETAVTVTVRGRTRQADITRTYPAATVHILPILGLYPGSVNTVDIRLYQGGSKTLAVETPPAEGAAELVRLKTCLTCPDDSLVVLAPAGFGRLTGFDRAGDIRWFISAGLQMGVKRLMNGRLLVGTERLVRPPYYSTGLYEMDLTGKIFAEFRIPGGYHHDQAEMPNGDLLVLSNDFSGNTVEDVYVLINRATGEIEKIWDFKTFLTPGEGSSGLASEEDWFHCNAVCYDENTHSLTFSGRHLDALVNIDFDTGALRWILGDPESWPENKKKYFFTPDAAGGFEWQYAQHACLVTPGGDIMCFDNGTLRSKNSAAYRKNKDNYSRGVRYSIDTGVMAIRQVWEYGRSRGPSFFSQHISNVAFLDEGHYLVHSGGIMLQDGVPAEGLHPPGPGSGVTQECVTLELLHDEAVMEMKCKGNFYRALKLGLRPADHTRDERFLYSPAEGARLGHLGITAATDAAGPATFSGELLHEDCCAHLIEETDRLCLKARFESEQNVRLLLCQGQTIRTYPVNTTDRFAQFSCLPYIEPDPRNTSTAVNKAGLSGLYDIRVSIDGKVYETGVTVTC